MSRLNFIFILTDQQRRDSLGCYGNPVCRTPHLDQLAGEGTLFENAFCANVICMPSRASILTGRYPSAHGLIMNGIPLAEEEVTLPQVLLDAGYTTASVGKLHLTPHNDEPWTTGASPYCSPEGRRWHEEGRPMPSPYYGFEQLRMHAGHPDDWTDHYRELTAIDPELPERWDIDYALQPPSGAPSSWKSGMPEEHASSVWVADEATACLERFAGADRPFFLFVGFPDPHFPYCPVAPWCDMYDPADVPLPNRSANELDQACADYRRSIDAFAAEWPYHPLEMPEAHIREIIAHTYGMVSQIDANVGRILARMRELALDESTAVVFLTDHGEHLGDHWLTYKAYPFDELVRLPMIWRVPGGPPGVRIDGMVSLVDILPTILDLAGADSPRGVQGRSFADALRGEPFEGRDAVLLEDDEEDNRSATRTLRTERYHMTFAVPDGDGSLFDMEDDPDQLVNRWSDPAYAKVKAELFERLAAEMMAACDPKPLRRSSS